MELASRSNRLVGQFLDGLVGSSLILVGALLTAVNDFLGGAVILIGVLWAIFYYLFADGFKGGQSIGKKWLKMRVVVADTGEPCGFGKSFVRNILLTLLGPIDWIFIFGEKRQRLGDMAAGTLVLQD